jgi:hypothetical protein
MKMRLYVFALMIFALLPTVVPAQDGAGPVLEAVARYIKIEHLGDRFGSLSVDPRVLPSQAGPAVNTTARHDSSLLAALNIPRVSTVESMQRAQLCAPDPRACVGGSSGFAIATFSGVDLRADSASLTVLVQHAKALTAEDSAVARTNTNPSDPVFWLNRMSRPVGQKLGVQLVRKSGGWVVAKVTVIGGS